MLGMCSRRGIARSIRARKRAGKRKGSGTWSTSPAWMPILRKGGRKMTAGERAIRNLDRH